MRILAWAVRIEILRSFLASSRPLGHTLTSPLSLYFGISDSSPQIGNFFFSPSFFIPPSAATFSSFFFCARFRLRCVLLDVMRFHDEALVLCYSER